VKALRDRTVLLVLSGSRAHGTASPSSDVDVGGAALPTRQDVLGLFERPAQSNTVDELSAFAPDLFPAERIIAKQSKLEGTIYGLRKFLKLAASGNPNLLEILFTRDAEIRRITPEGELLRASRGLFLTAKCRHTFAGYAVSQLGRIKLHYRWHTNGPARAPSRGDFELPEQTLLPRPQLDAAEAAIRKRVDSWELDLSGLEPARRLAIEDQLRRVLLEREIGSDEQAWLAAARWVGLHDNLIEVLQAERKWRTARDEWRRYKGWLAHRNPERAALEAKFGYDTKHGAHLVRLVRMGLEVLKTGKLHVWRGDRDADELRAIREGAWSYDRLLTWSDTTQRALRDIPTALPERVDRERLEQLYQELVIRGLAL